jgi:hypothetical protein
VNALRNGFLLRREHVLPRDVHIKRIGIVANVFHLSKMPVSNDLQLGWN